MTDALAVEHLPLARQVVRARARRLPSHVDVDDLHQAAALALVLAGRRFDDSRGVPFGAYATQVINGAITDHLRAQDWAPREVRAAISRGEASERAIVPLDLVADAPTGGYEASVDQSIDIARALEALSGRQRDVITGLLADERTSDTARRLGIPHSRVSEAKAAACRRLRSLLA